MAALPSTLRRELQRQLRALTPWHVRVSIRSSARRTSVRIWSLRWVASCSVSSEPTQPIALEVANTLLLIQSFVAEQTGLLWPTALQPATGKEFPEVLIPDVTVGEESVTVIWRRDGEQVFALTPLPV